MTPAGSGELSVNGSTAMDTSPWSQGPGSNYSGSSSGCDSASSSPSGRSGQY